MSDLWKTSRKFLGRPAPARRPRFVYWEGVSSSLPFTPPSGRETAPTRLRRERVRAGFTTMKDFALHVGVGEDTYRSHATEPGKAKHRGMGEAYAQLYAEALGVSWMWLLYGSEVAPRTGALTSPSAPEGAITSAQLFAALRPILERLELDGALAEPIAAALIRALKSVSDLSDENAGRLHYELAGRLAAQEIGRPFRPAGKPS